MHCISPGNFTINVIKLDENVSLVTDASQKKYSNNSIYLILSTHLTAIHFQEQGILKVIYHFRFCVPP